jgi:2-dehydro-3-deoxyphosphogluconate aldolase/(4S)-4-hydroxy-2-oxoglutarate aldolase
MHKILEEIGLLGIVPVIVLDDEHNAEPLAQALVDGGLPCAEVTLRTSAARQSIKKISQAFPRMLIGAGTVLSADQAALALDLGAKFVVSPGFDPQIVEYCLKHNIPVLPGVATPSEAQLALRYGIDVVKFFPAEANGGLAFLKALGEPFRSLRYIPTGGIDESNLLEYLRFPRVLACGGSWMAKPELTSARNFAEITRRTREAVDLMLGFEVRHIGINTSGPDEAKTVAEQLRAVFGFAVDEQEGSIFVGTQFEVLKRTCLGARGHVAIGTHFIDRAVDYFRRKGIAAKEETRNIVDDRLRSVYLEPEPGGFAIHLLQM